MNKYPNTIIHFRTKFTWVNILIKPVGYKLTRLEIDPSDITSFTCKLVFSYFSFEIMVKLLICINKYLSSTKMKTRELIHTSFTLTRSTQKMEINNIYYTTNKFLNAILWNVLQGRILIIYNSNTRVLHIIDLKKSSIARAFQNHCFYGFHYWFITIS